MKMKMPRQPRQQEVYEEAKEAKGQAKANDPGGASPTARWADPRAASRDPGRVAGSEGGRPMGVSPLCGYDTFSFQSPIHISMYSEQC